MVSVRLWRLKGSTSLNFRMRNKYLRIVPAVENELQWKIPDRRAKVPLVGRGFLTALRGSHGNTRPLTKHRYTLLPHWCELRNRPKSVTSPALLRCPIFVTSPASAPSIFVTG